MTNRNTAPVRSTIELTGTAFTRCINVRNVNEALGHGLNWLRHCGVESPSRAGTVVRSPVPVITCYTKPEERVLFSPMRNANPFFHLMEALWMLAGRRDVAWLDEYNSTFKQFSDDGENFHGAYGHRWREYFGYDQLQAIIDELKTNPTTRRCVLTMWDAGCWTEDEPEGVGDLHVAIRGGKDVPCNTNVFFGVRGPVLDMMVNCRSNDIIWGAYGANAVHMSMLLEYMASAIGLQVGRYWQSSWDYHAYTDRYPLSQFADLATNAMVNDEYGPGCKAFPLMNIAQEEWDTELANFMGGENSFTDPFFEHVAVPMRRAWRAHKARDYHAALQLARSIIATDWNMAAVQWLQRAKTRWEGKEQSE